MSSEFNEDYFKKLFNEIPVDVRTEAIAWLRNSIPPSVKEEIRESHKKYGPHNWIHKDEKFGHFFWGMGCRNALRTAGFTDDKFPGKNLDDYYVSLVEAAVIEG
jgi:hypothetical protein